LKEQTYLRRIYPRWRRLPCISQTNKGGRRNKKRKEKIVTLYITMTIQKQI